MGAFEGGRGREEGGECRAHWRSPLLKQTRGEGTRTILPPPHGTHTCPLPPSSHTGPTSSPSHTPPPPLPPPPSSAVCRHHSQQGPSGASALLCRRGACGSHPGQHAAAQVCAGVNGSGGGGGLQEPHGGAPGRGGEGHGVTQVGVGGRGGGEGRESAPGLLGSGGQSAPGLVVGEGQSRGVSFSMGERGGVRHLVWGHLAHDVGKQVDNGRVQLSLPAL